MKKIFATLVTLSLFFPNAFGQSEEFYSDEARKKQDIVLKKIIKQDEYLTRGVSKQSQNTTDFFSFLKSIYLKAEVGSLIPIKAKDKNVESRLKSKSSIFYGFGIGSNFGESSRFELDLSLHNKIKPKGTGTLNVRRNIILSDNSISRSADIINYTASVYMNMFEFGPAKIFIGGGLGAATIKEKVSFTEQRFIPRTNQRADPINTSRNNKKITNFAYSAGAGITLGLSDKVNIDLKYSFKDFGKTKTIIYNNDQRLPGVKYRAHTISTSLRVSF